MALYITQKPLYGDVNNGAIPVGQQVVFSVEDAFQVQNRYNVKYVAEVHIGTNPINLSVGTQLVASFKTTPNNAGVGIFDLQSILEGYVSSDNLGSTSGNGSTYKGVTYTNSKSGVFGAPQFRGGAQERRSRPAAAPSINAGCTSVACTALTVPVSASPGALTYPSSGDVSLAREEELSAFPGSTEAPVRRAAVAFHERQIRSRRARGPPGPRRRLLRRPEFPLYRRRAPG